MRIPASPVYAQRKSVHTPAEQNQHPARLRMNCKRALSAVQNMAKRNAKGHLLQRHLAQTAKTLIYNQLDKTKECVENRILQLPDIAAFYTALRLPMRPRRHEHPIRQRPNVRFGFNFSLPIVHY